MGFGISMVDVANFDVIDKSKSLKFSDFNSSQMTDLSANDASIFSDSTSISVDNVDSLQMQLDTIEQKQGFLSNTWNEIKETTGLGTSVKKCDEAIEKYKNGEISFEEASATIEEFSQKQDSSLDLFSNIATGIAAIAAASLTGAAIVASGGTATPLVLAAIGAGTGAATKTAYKFTDRATNDIDGDALDSKQILKDGLSGAVTGTIATATMGTGSSSGTLFKSLVNGASKSAKTGFITGAISGSSNYFIDTALDENKDFDTKEFLATTATSAAVGTAVGGIMGSANAAMRYTGVLKHGGMVKVDDNTGKLLNATTEDIVANSACNAEYKLVNNGIRSVAA